jgi:AbrB family looped-hinge helix DNA binding protein
MRSTITSKGQTTVPKAVREKLGVGYGDEIDFVIQADGSVVVKAATRDIRALKGLLHRKGKAPVTGEEMQEAIRRRAAGRK